MGTHAETSNDDGKFILKRAKVDNITHLPGIYASSPTLKSKTIELFRNVSIKTIEKLYSQYKADFDMFGYDIEDYRNLKNNKRAKRDGYENITCSRDDEVLCL